MRGEQLFNLACRHHDSGRFDHAIELLTQILGENPNMGVAHGLLASCLLAQNRIVAAEYESGIALGLEPNNPFVHEVRARILIVLQRFDEGVVRLEAQRDAAFVLRRDDPVLRQQA